MDEKTRNFSTNRVVVKVGTSSLAHKSGLINYEKVENIILQLADLKNKGVEVVFVTSGAIGAGMGRLGLDKSTSTLSEKQAMAAVGQNILMHIYSKFASEYGVNVGQILLTQEDFKDEKKSTYSKNALMTLLRLSVLPVVNENDAVAVEEIKFGDNDQLSAMVAKLIEADLLIILTDIDGLYDKNPKSNPDAKLLSHVNNITDDMMKSAGDTLSTLGTGGMTTKLLAADIAHKSGIKTIIANSNEKNVLMRLIKGECIGTFFE